jgi:hypothetical protein
MRMMTFWQDRIAIIMIIKINVEWAKLYHY